MPRHELPVEWEIVVSVVNGQVVVMPDTCRLSSRRGDQVVWVCYDGELTVEFDEYDGNPFDPMELPANLAAGTAKNSGRPVSGAQRSYKYTAKVLRDGDTVPLELDPEVIVDDNTPPPAGSKMARAAKPAASRAKPRKKSAKRAPKKAAKKKATKKKAAKKRTAKKAAKKRGTKKAAKKRPMMKRKAAKKKAARGKAKQRPMRRKAAKKKSARPRKKR